MFDLQLFTDSDHSFACAGVRVQRLYKGQVHMDMDFKWGGDGDIVLNVVVMGMTKLPIQVLENFVLDLKENALIEKTEKDC